MTRVSGMDPYTDVVVMVRWKGISMKILIAAVGTLGDVEPYVAWAEHL